MLNIRWNANADINGTSLTGYVTFPDLTTYKAAGSIIEAVSGQNYAANRCEDTDDGMFTGELVIPGDTIPFTLYNRWQDAKFHIGLRDWDYRLDVLTTLGLFFKMHQIPVVIGRE